MRRDGNRVFLKDWTEYLDLPANKIGSSHATKINCPVCEENGKKKEKSLYITPSLNYCKCFKCGTTFLIEGKQGDTKIKAEYTAPKRENLTLLNDAGLQYLVDRHISQEAIKHCKIVMHKTFPDTIVFPYTYHSELVNWKSRSIKEKKFGQSGNGAHVMWNYDDAISKPVIIIHEGECTKGDTEILTPSGWIRLDEYNGQQVGQVNDGKLEFVLPNAYIINEYSGDYIDFKHLGFSFGCTANHNLFVHEHNKKGKIKIKAKDLSSQRMIDRVAFYNGGEGLPMTDAELRLMVALSADFSFRKTGYLYGSFKKDRKKLRFKELISLTGVECQNLKDCRDGYESFSIHAKDAPWYACKLFPHEYIGKMNRRQINVFLEEILFWDGNSVPNRNQIEYSTKEISNATFVQTLAHISGFTSTIIPRQNAFGKWFKVSILFDKKTSSLFKEKTTTSYYSGNVYCVNVPSGLILVRHNQHISVTGNCDVLASTTALIKHGDIDQYGVVSVDMGAPSPTDTTVDAKLACFTNCYDLIENAEMVVIAVDADEPGLRLKRELQRRIPAEKLFTVDFGEHKDANEYLKWLGSEALFNLLVSPTPYTPESIITVNDVMAELLDMYDNGLAKGESTFFPSVDTMWKWRLTEVNIFTGYNNEGKTTYLEQISLIKSAYSGWPVASFSPEAMPPAYYYEQLVHMLTGTSTDKDFNGRLPRDKYIKALKYIQERVFLVAPANGRTKLTELLEKFKFLIYKKGVRILNIDPLMKLIPTDSARADYYAADFMGELTFFAKAHGVAVNLVAHQGKPERGPDNNFKKPNLYGIKGGGTFSDSADNVIVVHRPNRATSLTDKSVDIHSDKIRFEKLVAPKGMTTLHFDWKSQQYEDPALGAQANPLRELWRDMNTTKTVHQVDMSLPF